MTGSTKILVFARLNPSQLNCIADVNERLDVQYVGDEFCIQEDRVFLKTPASLAGGRLREQLTQSDILLGYPGNFEPGYPLPRLRWVQLLSAGFNHITTTPVWKNGGITVTNASGVHATPMAEHAIMCMLMLNADALQLFRQQGQHIWNRWHRVPLSGQSVGILGFGAIGSEVGRLSAAVGMKVRAMDAMFSSRKLNMAGAAECFAPSQLHSLLQSSDFVVNCLPLTDATTRLMGVEEFAAMRPGSFFISLSRGPIVDHQALIDALRTEHLGGAALDVTDPEPLPPDSPLWDMPNVIITPHISGIFQGYMERLTDLFCHNLRLYLQGQPLVNVVNKELGY